MNNETLATREKQVDGFTVKYSFIAVYNGCLGQANFNDQWERASQHQGGATIQSDGEHWTPKQYSLAQLSSDYASQGRENPCKEAYQSLLRQFERDSEAFEVVLEVSVLKNDVELFADTVIGSDYHYLDFDYDHNKALECLLEYAEESAYINGAKETLKSLLVE